MICRLVWESRRHFIVQGKLSVVVCIVNLLQCSVWVGHGDGVASVGELEVCVQASCTCECAGSRGHGR